jgi:hypothetical protein
LQKIRCCQRTKVKFPHVAVAICLHQVSIEVVEDRQADVGPAMRLIQIIFNKEDHEKIAIPAICSSSVIQS